MTSNKNRRLLELFSGTGSVNKVSRQLGYEVVSVDLSDKYHTPTHLVNIMDFDYRQYPPHHFDVVWSSPPCECFSPINRLRIKKEPEVVRQRMMDSLPLLRRVEEIIDYFQPTFYFIENPDGYMKDFIDRPMYMVDYCKYSDFGYRKRTCIWTNRKDLDFQLCHRDCQNMEGKKHRLSITRCPLTLQQKYRVPYKLIKYLIQ